MKVDSTGQAVSEGTFGLLHGSYSARVARTFVDPSKDSEDTQEIIANGGYIVDTGSSMGLSVAYPTDFTATYDGDTVKARDGQIVEVGDVVAVDGSLSEGTVRTLYPIGALAGTVCCSLKEKRGGAPDGYWAVGWGTITTVLKKAPKRAKADTNAANGPWETPAGLVYKGDVVRAHHDTYGDITAKVTKGRLSDSAELVLYLQVLEHDQPATGPVGTVKQWFATRVTEVVSYDNPTPGELAELEVGDWVYFTDDDGKESSGVITSLTPDSVRAVLDPGCPAYTKDNPDYAYILDKTQILRIRKQREESDMMAAKSDKFGKVEVVREGTQIILPTGMGLRKALEELKRQAEQEEMDVNIMELIQGFPLDAAHAFVKALEQKYGWVNALPTPGFFGPQPPVMIGVQVDPDGRTVQIPWGQLGIPGISGKLTTGIQFVDQRPVFCIGGTIKQKDKGVVNEIAQMTREYLKAGGSIYKGKAIRVKFPTDPTKFSPLDHQPKFIPTAEVRPEELIFSESVEKLIKVNLWTLIMHTEAVRAARIPVKRGVLVFGKYGVGKTLMAAVTARMSVQQGVTFMDLADSRQLPQAVPFARQLGGMVVIFAEDIDRCDENGTRSDAFNEILNVVDGLTSKTDEIVVVMTTNHVERISPALLRPGRLDAVVEIHPPDAQAVQKLVRLYARHLLAPEEDITEVGRVLAGEIPAVIREVVERSKLAAIARGDVHHICADDLLVQAAGMKRHLELLQEKPRDDRSELEKLGDALGARVAQAINGSIDSEADTAMVAEITRRKVA